MKLSKEDKKFLELYSDSKYDKPSVTIDTVVFRLVDKETDNYRKLAEKKLQVFLTERQFSPFKNQFSIVGTFVDLNFELSDSVKLCLMKKIGLKNFYFEQLYTFGEKKRDPRTRAICVSYMALLNGDKQLANGEWFDMDFNIIENKTEKTSEGFRRLKRLEIILKNQNHCMHNEIFLSVEKQGLNESRKVEIIKTDLAFDHVKMIFYAYERLKNKIEYTDIIFNLLPTKFTLTELKLCYEEILKEKLLDANFRRKIANKVVPVDEFVTGKGHRSSQLFIQNIFSKINNLD